MLKIETIALKDLREHPAMPARLKALGLDAKKLLDEHAPAPKEEKPAKASKKKAPRK